MVVNLFARQMALSVMRAIGKTQGKERDAFFRQVNKRKKKKKDVIRATRQKVKDRFLIRTQSDTPSTISALRLKSDCEQMAALKDERTNVFCICHYLSSMAL
ncbi:hypothetical protein CEXT_440031 [Caerostris extrusa]|uniref:Uncharacterized protein n=1 Tax=Caerostris extrusa TaxID=172846 RepID=A0AAV4S8C9_CAEEX|nr:hypothetical protein CEXT_440031 [Caerostris extrusa]